MIAFVCAMPMELRPLRRRLGLRKSGAGYVGKIGDRAVIAMVTGIGTALAGSATARLLDAVDVEWVVVVGITGAIDDDTPIGRWFCPNGSSTAPTARCTDRHRFASVTPTGRCGPPTSC